MDLNPQYDAIGAYGANLRKMEEDIVKKVLSNHLGRPVDLSDAKLCHRIYRSQVWDDVRQWYDFFYDGDRLGIFQLRYSTAGYPIGWEFIRHQERGYDPRTAPNYSPEFKPKVLTEFTALPKK